MDNKQLYKITLTREQLMLISRCVEDISRYAAGDMDLQHTTETLINDMDRTETLGICKEFNDLKCEMLIDMAKKIEEYLL